MSPCGGRWRYTQMFVVPYQTPAIALHEDVEVQPVGGPLPIVQTLQRIGANRAGTTLMYGLRNLTAYGGTYRCGALSKAALARLVLGGDLSGGGEFICRWKRHTQSKASGGGTARSLTATALQQPADCDEFKFSDEMAVCLAGL